MGLIAHSHCCLCVANRPADEAPSSQEDPTAPAAPQQQQQQQRRRVTFDADAVQQDRQQQQQQWRRPPPPRGGRGRGRGRGVPDHIVNPHKYTVYELDEPLFVGQGGGDVENQAAAGNWQQERQQWGQQQQQQQQRPGKVKQLDPGSRAETEGPLEELRVGVPAPAAAAAAGGDVAPMEVEEAGAPRELPTAIKFAPTTAVKGGWGTPSGRLGRPGLQRMGTVVGRGSGQVSSLPGA